MRGRILRATALCLALMGLLALSAYGHHGDEGHHGGHHGNTGSTEYTDTGSAGSNADSNSGAAANTAAGGVYKDPFVHHGEAGGRRRCAEIFLCAAEGCTAAGRHTHSGALCCGYPHEGGLCGGACCPLCPEEGCTLERRHLHEGMVYCGFPHAAGFCDGSCDRYSEMS